MEMTVNSYFTEPIIWGGLPATRGEVINSMQQDGFTRQEIDWYLAGLDSGIERRKRLQVSNNGQTKD
jgi:hypothetical protein